MGTLVYVSVCDPFLLCRADVSVVLYVGSFLWQQASLSSSSSIFQSDQKASFYYLLVTLLLYDSEIW